MGKYTKRDWWAFCTGQSLAGVVMAYLIHLPGIFLLNAVLLVWDAYMFQKEVDKTGAK